MTGRLWWYHESGVLVNYLPLLSDQRKRCIGSRRWGTGHRKCKRISRGLTFAYQVQSKVSLGISGCGKVRWARLVGLDRCEPLPKDSQICLHCLQSLHPSHESAQISGGSGVLDGGNSLAGGGKVGIVHAGVLNVGSAVIARREGLRRLNPCRNCASGSLLQGWWQGEGMHTCHLCGRSNRPAIKAQTGGLREPYLPEKGYVIMRRSVPA